jgi:hypothetical protein
MPHLHRPGGAARKDDSMQEDESMRIVHLLPAVALALVVLAPGSVGAQMTKQQVEAGLSLLPADARAGAEVQFEAEDGWVVHRSGDNGWTCRISTPTDGLAAKCYHSVLTGKIELEAKLYAEGLPSPQVREHMAVMLENGTLSIPPGSVEITGSGDLGDGVDVPATLSGYYFVYFPFETAKTFGVPGADPGEGRPWLHHAGTADAHLMWRHSHETGM